MKRVFCLVLLAALLGAGSVARADLLSDVSVQYYYYDNINNQVGNGGSISFTSLDNSIDFGAMLKNGSATDSYQLTVDIDPFPNSYPQPNPQTHVILLDELYSASVPIMPWDAPDIGTYSFIYKVSDDLLTIWLPSSIPFSLIVTHGLTAQELNFGTVSEGYTPTLPLTATNVGNGNPAVPTAVALESSSDFDIVFSGGNIAQGATGQVAQVKPKAGLAPGTYSDNLLLSYTAPGASNTWTIKVPVTLTVTAAPLTAPTQITPLEPTVTAGGSTTLTADGNPAPTFALDGSQPPGVTISTGGMLSVVSTVAPGTYTFGVTATNSEGSVTQTITLTVKAKSSGGGSSDDWEPVEDIKGYEQAIVIKCREWANVRSGPSTDTEIVGRVYLGESISLLQWNKDETWCKILYDGDSKTGWLYYKFIKPVK